MLKTAAHTLPLQWHSSLITTGSLIISHQSDNHTQRQGRQALN